MPRRSIALLTLIIAIILTIVLSFVAVRNYLTAAPVADDNLRGLALTIASAMEGMAGRDTSLKSLASFHTNEIAYAMLIESSGKIFYHSNPDLTGNDVGDIRYLNVVTTGNYAENRIRLGTGEQIYEFQAPFHLSGKTFVLRIALHTWRSEAVMRRARFAIAMIFSLLTLGWLLGGSVFWLLQRQDVHEKQLARQNELARLGEVGAVLAHEVRNPLAGIKGYGQLLEERLPEGRERNYARLIVEETRRMETLVSDILLYTRSEPMPVAVCRLAEVAASVIELLAPQAAESRVRITCTVQADITVLCPEDGARRILLNLITNALQAAPGDSQITISGVQDGTWSKLSIADNGSGISAAMLPLLFEPFRTSKARGAGLGLAVCKKIIDSCGGDISVGEVSGGGAIFTVRLPLAEKDGDVC